MLDVNAMCAVSAGGGGLRRRSSDELQGSWVLLEERPVCDRVEGARPG